jgi:tripartite-type tricarboxylate transporter receptor subunit TctC
LRYEDASGVTPEQSMTVAKPGRTLAALVLCGAAAALLVSHPTAFADPVSEFYAGKTVNLVIGYAPGGGYDLYARTLGRHMARHIPGSPNIVVQNMPGAGSLKAANYLYTIAPKDGTTFGGFSRGAPIDPLLGRGEGVQFEAAKFGWLGSISNEVGVCAFRSAVGIKSFADMQTKPFIIGATGVGADSDVFPTVLRKMFKLPMRTVAGYASAAEVVVAIKRAEVDGRCGWSWSSLVSWNRDMWESKQLDVVLQLGTQKVEDLPDVPLVTEVTKDPDQQTALKLIMSRQTMARPYVAPPGVPAERLAVLRAAFEATTKDPAFLADAKRQDLEVRPVGGAEAQVLIREIYATPPALVKLAIDYMKD